MPVSRSLLISFTLLAAGCAPQADIDALVPRFASVGRTHSSVVSVAVTGGKEGGAWSTPTVTNHEFQEALQASLLKFRVFSHVVSSGGADYRLDVRIVDFKQPSFGFNMTASARTEWKLTSVRSGKVVWHDTIAPAFTATVGDAFQGSNRSFLAREGAIRETIKLGIERIAKLSL